MLKTSLMISTVLAGLVAALPAHAGVVVTYYGADNGAGPGSSDPNTVAATAAFTAADPHTSLITFEGASLPNVAPGVSVTLTGADGGGLVSTDQHSPTPLGFNTTPGGKEWLQIWPAFNSSTGETATFTFAKPIDAFGADFTDTQVDFPGPITLTFNDGSTITETFNKNNDTGGILFFGFTDFGKGISSVAINTGATGSTRDIWGIDDVRFQTASTVPELSTWAMMIFGFAGLGLVGYRASRRPEPIE
jgi:hypothetical protein